MPDKSSKGYDRVPDKEALNPSLITGHLVGKLKAKENEEVKEASHALFPDGRLIVERPLGYHASFSEPQKKLQPKQGRVSTGLEGLDNIMEGGYKRKSVVLVGGGAGTGKSIFCIQFLIKGIEEHNESGIYISFEETEEELVENMERFGWNLRKKIDDGKLVIMHYTPEQVKQVLEKGGGVVRDAIESIKAKRLVLDSLTAFNLLYDNELMQRKNCLALFKAIKKWDCTALLIAEHELDPEHHHSSVLEFEADGVVLLYNIRKGDVRQRSMEVLKMRDTKHSAKIFPMRITANGIEIYPAETLF